MSPGTSSFQATHSKAPSPRSPVRTIVRSPLLRYLLQRVWFGATIVAGAVIVSFLLVNLAGDPTDVRGGALLTLEQRQELREQLGYDKPLLERLGNYLLNASHGDFGASYRTGESAVHATLSALPNTAALVLVASLVACGIAVPLAAFCAIRPNSRADRIVVRTMMVLQGIPEFWLAVMLTLLFAVNLQLLPAVGKGGPESWVLPTATLAIPMFPALVRLLRGQLMDIMGLEFITALRAKGLTERRIVYRHGLLNAGGQFVTLLALQLGWLLGGTLVIEVVFSWPGIGSLLYDAVKTRDLAIIQAVVVLVAVAYVALNLAADLLVMRLDPRIRSGRR